jgi:hypothetical protein
MIPGNLLCFDHSVISATAMQDLIFGSAPANDRRTSSPTPYGLAGALIPFLSATSGGGVRSGAGVCDRIVTKKLLAIRVSIAYTTAA